jgi:hypothetical protein
VTVNEATLVPGSAAGVRVIRRGIAPPSTQAGIGVKSRYGAARQEESGDCGVMAPLSGFVGAPALQRPMRRLSFAGANVEARMTRAALLSVIGILLLGAAARAETATRPAASCSGSCENEAMAPRRA